MGSSFLLGILLPEGTRQKHYNAVVQVTPFYQSAYILYRPTVVATPEKTLILSAAVCELDIWPLTLRKGHTLEALVKKAQRKPSQAADNKMGI
jgi:hypothetical protein